MLILIQVLLLFLSLPQGGLLQNIHQYHPHPHPHQRQQQQQQQPQQQQQQHQQQLHHQNQYQHLDHNGYQGENSLTIDQLDHQHHDVAVQDAVQHVLLDQAKQQYHVAHTQIEWNYESNQDGELSQFYMHNYESSYPVIVEDQKQQLIQSHPHQKHQKIYQYQQVHRQHHQQHSLYSRLTDDDHAYHGYQYQQPSQSCNSNENPSSLMYSNLQHYEFHQGVHYQHQQEELHLQHQYQEHPESTCRANSFSSSSSQSPQQSQLKHSQATPHSTSSVGVTVLSHITNKASTHNSNIESYPLASHPYHYESSLLAAIRHYWKEVLTLCVGSSIFLNWLIAVIKRRFVSSNNAINRGDLAIEPAHKQTTRSISKDTNSSSAQDSAFEEAAIPLSLDDGDNSKSSSSHQDRSSQSLKTFTTTNTIRQRSSTLKAESMPIPIPVSPKPGHNSPSTSLSNSLNTSEYISRYSSDFDSIQRLGRGGFGVVFEAKNKIDDCHYAVKRICLPLEKEARERVMREVRALAKLDHAGIVRYYNAWLETPPEDWLKQHDAQLGIVNSKDGFNFPSTDGIYERNESEITRRGKKLGESGDGNSSSLFGSSPFKRRENGLHRYLKDNSSSPSLDIVFEGSGSIRLEAENTTEKTKSSKRKKHNKNGHKNPKFHEDTSGDINNSDSEDSDFIQFESKSNNNSSNRLNNQTNGHELSINSQLTDPFSSSSSSGSRQRNKSESSSGDDDGSYKDITNCTEHGDNFSLVDNNYTSVCGRNDKRNALKYQNEFRRFNNAALAENLHVEKVYLYIQMQLCRKDTLKDWLKTNCENRDKTTIFDLFYQIVDAVEYVHSQDLIHRDLKPSNIFFSLDGTLKIGDFGLCRAKTSVGIGSSLDLQEYVGESEVERGFEAVHTEQVGTQLYMSPEQLNGLSYNQKVDIFAMGLILLELLVPFKTQMQRVNVLFKARNNLYSDEFKKDHPREHELVKSLLCRSPLKRPTATEIKQHDLLASAQLSQPVIDRIYHRRRTISSNSSNE